MTLAFCLLGILKDQELVDGFRKMSCTVIGTIHDMNWGATTDDGKVWLGVNGVKKEFNSLLYSLENDLPAKINSRFSGNADSIAQSYDDLLAKLEKVYTDYRLKTVADPRPNMVLPIIPDYFTNLGPTTS
jgi:hypothetical protein